MDADDAAIDRFRPYLRLLATLHLERPLRGKFDPSDLVQQTLLEAHQARQQFRGTESGQMAAWLRQILVRNLANARRDFGREKRDVRRERSLEANLDASASRLERFLAADQASPSEHAMRHERGILLAAALETLPAAQKRAVILRHLLDCSLVQIAEELACSESAAAGLIHRGVKSLRSALQTTLGDKKET